MATIQGVVQDGASQTGVDEVVIMITGDSPDHHDLAAATDSQGQFRLAGLVAGRYTLLVNAAGFTPQTVTAIATEAQETSIVVRLSRR